MALSVGAPLPSFDDATAWLNGQVSDAELQGHPVLVDFWAVSCPFCLRNMPVLHRWREEYGAQGLRIVTVHLPRGNEDKNFDAVRQAVAEHNITDPCALDHDGIISARFETGGIWPYYFLFDARGTLRSRAAGKVGLNLLENALKRSLAATTTV